METQEQDYSETLSQILQELQTLNTNLAEYTTYIKDRNTQADEAAAQKEQEAQEQAEQEAKEAEEAAKQEASETVENQELTVTTVDKLSDIHATLEDFETAYKDISATTQATDSNLEFNSNMNFVNNAIGLGLLAILIGLHFGRIVFRKL